MNDIFSYLQISTMSGMRGGGGGKLEDLMMAYADLKAPSKTSGVKRKTLSHMPLLYLPPPPSYQFAPMYMQFICNTIKLNMRP